MLGWGWSWGVWRSSAAGKLSSGEAVSLSLSSQEVESVTAELVAVSTDRYSFSPREASHSGCLGLPADQGSTGTGRVRSNPAQSPERTRSEPAVALRCSQVCELEGRGIKGGGSHIPLQSFPRSTYVLFGFLVVVTNGFKSNLRKERLISACGLGYSPSWQESTVLGTWDSWLVTWHRQLASHRMVLPFRLGLPTPTQHRDPSQTCFQRLPLDPI